MAQLEAESPRELSKIIGDTYGIALGVFEHEQATGQIPYYPRNPIQELRVEHQGQRIPLTELGLVILVWFQNGTEYARNLGNFRERIPNFANRSPNPTRSWGSEMADLAEQELIPKGLLEVDPVGYSTEVYRLSARAHGGRYAAIVDESIVEKVDRLEEILGRRWK